MADNHDVLIREFAAQWQPLLDNSGQAVYVYLDDLHKICNEKFSSLLGYPSPDAWSAVTESFPAAFVAEASQRTLVGAYRKAMEKMVGSTIDVTWKKRSGRTVDSTVTLVPVVFNNHLLALHFISRKSTPKRRVKGRP